MNAVGGFFQYSALAMGVALFASSYLSNSFVDITSLSPDALEQAVSSDEFCSLHVTKDGLGVSSLNLDFWKTIFLEKLSLRMLLQFVAEQLQFNDIIEEVLLSKRFWIISSFVMMCTGSIHTFILQRMGSLIHQKSDRDNLELAELSIIGKISRGYFLDKLAVLMFCVVRAYSPPNNKQYIDFGEYVRDHIALKSRLTDLSLLASWFSLLFLVHFSAELILFRFVKTIPLVSPPIIITELRAHRHFISLFITICSVSVYSGVLFGSAILTFSLLHPLYATVLVLESYRAFLRSLYVVHRVSVIFSVRRMSSLELQKDTLSREELAQRVVSTKSSSLKQFHECSTLLISFFLNIFYAIAGLAYNRRILAIGFLMESFRSFRQLTNYEDNYDNYD